MSKAKRIAGHLENGFKKEGHTEAAYVVVHTVDKNHVEVNYFTNLPTEAAIVAARALVNMLEEKHRKELLNGTLRKV